MKRLAAGICVAVVAFAACGGSSAKVAPTPMQLARRLERAGFCPKPSPVRHPAHTVRCAADATFSHNAYVLSAYPTREALLHKIEAVTRLSCRDGVPFEYVGGDTWVAVGAPDEYAVANVLKGRVIKPEPCTKSETL